MIEGAGYKGNGMSKAMMEGTICPTWMFSSARLLYGGASILSP